jgi:hypothetical protein
MKFNACALLLVLLLSLAACGDDSTPPAPDLGPADAGNNDLGADALVACTTDAQCADGVFCNGVERCTPGAAGADARGCVVATSTPCLPTQTCNEVDNLCETSCDTGADADGDGHDATACGGDDCDDSDANRYPGNTEVCDAAGHDEDCDATTYGTDVDGDTFLSTGCCNTQPGGALACGTDCDDSAGGANVHPGAPESCNGVDDDCNGVIDEGVQTGCYLDADGDGYAAVGAAAVMMCSCSTGYTATAPATAADCNDANIHINPAVPEVCNLIDDNCNTLVDEDVGNTYYRDLDHDGQGSVASGTIVACSMPATGYAPDATDCNDACATCYIGATEICDGMDNNCSSTTDENLGAFCTEGIGACAVTGQRRCDGSCTAVGGTPDAAFHTGVAPNGSWDWNCDGVTTPETAINNTTHSSAANYCAAQTCPAPVVCGWTTCPSTLAITPQTGLFTPGGGVSPYCGLGLWSVSGTCSGTMAGAGPCLGPTGASTTGVQRCR